MKDIKVTQLLKSDMEEMADRLSKIASKYNLILESCSEEIPLDTLGINHGKCIDDKLISKLIGCNINAQKDSNQREVCGCVKSIHNYKKQLCCNQEHFTTIKSTTAYIAMPILAKKLLKNKF